MAPNAAIMTPTMTGIDHVIADVGEWLETILEGRDE